MTCKIQSLKSLLKSSIYISLLVFTESLFAAQADAHLAASMCMTKEVSAKLQSGFNIETQDDHTGTLLIAWATLRRIDDDVAYPTPCDKECTEARKRSNILACEETFKILIRHKAQINAKNNRGTTALMKAAQRGHIFALKLLLAEKADINAINNYGNTALHEAVYNNQYEILEYLFKMNANDKIRNIRSLTPLDVAIKKQDQRSINVLKMRR